MDVHPHKNGINRYWSIPIWVYIGYPSIVLGFLEAIITWLVDIDRYQPIVFFSGRSGPASQADPVLNEAVLSSNEADENKSWVPSLVGSRICWVIAAITLQILHWNGDGRQYLSYPKGVLQYLPQWYSKVVSFCCAFDKYEWDMDANDIIQI